MRDRAKSFYFATRVLPPAKRSAVEALYGFCRFTDDIADAAGPSAAERRATFTAIRSALLELGTAHGEGAFAWLPALRCTFERFPLDVRDALRLVDGCERDLEPADVGSMDELHAYAVAVAGTVGRCTLPILGANDPDSLARGELLGVAMQYTNVLRDVAEDRAMGRNYLPRREFYGVPIPQIMRDVARRARSYYLEARMLAPRVPNDGSRMALLLAGAVYEGILDRLARRDYDPFSGRASVPLPSKLGCAVRSMFVAYAGFPTMR